jgi:ubiquinone/menaquinone biosynthesis C-methylase UbiE
MGERLKLGEYLLAVEGLAMIRTCLTEPSAARPRVEEIRAILAGLADTPDIPMTEYEVPEGYARWAERYDGPNPAITREQPIVHGMLAELPPGRALDAACGTGRHAVKLHELGHQVVGVDATPAMLSLARKKVPGADFRVGKLEELPVQDATVDLITCALALSHLDDLRPAITEFARVLKPGGRVIISDIHPQATLTGAIAAFPGRDLTKGVPYVRSVIHQLGSYLAAFRAAGLSVVDCLEPPVDEGVIAATPSYTVYPEAARQAFFGMPYLIVWQLIK